MLRAPRTRPVVLLALTAAAVLPACTENMGGYDQISVTLNVSGTGAGVVSENETDVNINCSYPGAQRCSDTFSDAGGGGQFALIATPAAGSVFGGWTGCTSVSGTVCGLAFSASEGNTSFTVGARFDLAAGGNNTIIFYNSASVSAYLVGPSESPGTGTLVVSHGSRDLAIPTTVGSQSTFKAFLAPGTPAATITCTVTASAWQADTRPLVLFDNSDGNRLTCSDGLAGL